MRKKRILTVDDESGFVRLLKLVLENTGSYEVRVELDATKAIETALEFRPDLILLDVVMPQINGGEVAARVKSHPELKETPIVFLTATLHKNLEGQINRIAGCPAFSKPIRLQELVGVMEENLPHGA